MNIVDKAFVFASAAHAAIGQKRKFSGEDYIVHPIEVASWVRSIKGDENMITAAYLHDTVEDTDVTLKLIENFFGEDVAELVENLTDISKPEDGNRKVRKEIDRQHTAKASARAKTIKLADLISNTRDITKQDKNFAVVYMQEKVALMEVLKEGNEELYAKAQNLIDDYYRE
jgi:(p)ppGpp synthase/HD superfamily hydrolase